MTSNRGTKVFTLFSTYASDPTFQSWWNSASTQDKQDAMVEEFGFSSTNDGSLMDALVNEGTDPWDTIQEALETEIGTTIGYSW